MRDKSILVLNFDNSVIQQPAFFNCYQAKIIDFTSLAPSASFILKEKFSHSRWLGTGLIVVGIVFVSLS